jgi:hypothetical protein
MGIPCNTRAIAVVTALALVALTCGPTARAAAPPPAAADFAKDVRPLLETYCFKCHAGEKVKGDVNLAGYKDADAVQRAPKFWQNVLTQVEERHMPPEGKPQPAEEQREKLAGWLRDTLNNLDFSKLPKDPGRVTARRLNAAEYNNTIRDLLGVNSRPADAFPADGGGGGGFDNNADTLFLPPILMEQYLRAAGNVLKEADADRLVAKRSGEEVSKQEAARASVEAFAGRAYRRPATKDEVDRLMRLFDAADKRGESFEDALRLALKGVLVSPQFLFRVEHDQESKEPYTVSDYELASRLSYFVWSSMPDEELLKLAGEKKLHDPEVLAGQVRRMLKDPKSKALAENFGGQWLTFRELKTTAQPDRKRFREFTPAVRDAMYDEAVEFVDSVFRDDAPLTTLIDADYTFLNDALAKHYGIKDVKGQEMRRVTLPPDSPRGGVLALGGVLTVTSYPLRTSPVLRGKLVLDEILGAPPPPPPPEVTELPQDDVQPDGLSFRKRLEAHRSRAECASCHARMDPIGFGLENFDPVGRWRTEQGGQPVDSGGELTTGEKFSGPKELKKILAKRKEVFARTVAEKMLAYALGRGLEFYDQPAVKGIADAVAKEDYRSSTLVVEIARSYPFRYRRNESSER